MLAIVSPAGLPSPPYLSMGGAPYFVSSRCASPKIQPSGSSKDTTSTLSTSSPGMSWPKPESDPFPLRSSTPIPGTPQDKDGSGPRSFVFTLQHRPRATRASVPKVRSGCITCKSDNCALLFPFLEEC